MADSPMPLEEIVKLTTFNLLAENMGVKERDQTPSSVKVDRLKDLNWVGKTFLIGEDDLEDPATQKGMFDSTVKYSFADTAMGGTMAINARAQSSPYVDPRPENAKGDYITPNIFNFDITSSGLGRDYHERLDRNTQKIYMRFGVPEYSNTLWFLSQMSSPISRILANTGRAPHWITTTIATMAGAAASAVFLGWVKVGLLLGLRTFTHIIADNAGTDFFYVKPTMPQYWSSVNTIVNEIAISAGLTPGVFKEGNRVQRAIKDLTDKAPPDFSEMQLASSVTNGIVDNNGYIDVMRIAGRYHRISNTRLMKLVARRKLYKDNLLYDKYLTESKEKVKDDDSSKYSLWSMLASLYQSDKPSEVKKETVDGKEVVSEHTQNSNVFDEDSEGLLNDSLFTRRMEHFRTELQGGSAFVVLEVEDTGSISENFGNSTEASAVGNMYNTSASTFRTMQHDLGGLLSTGKASIDDVLQEIKNGFEIGTDAATFGVSGFLTNLIAGGNIEIPDRWSGSTGKLPSASYKITSTIVYDDPLARIQYIYTLVAMLLSGSLPLKTGASSHTSPYLVELFDRGRARIRKGIIDSLSITRGGGNLGFNRHGKLMRIEISFSVIDLAPAFAMPIATGSWMDISPESASKQNQDAIFKDYVSILSGRSVGEEIFMGSKIKTAWKRFLNDSKSVVSMSHIDMMMGNAIYESPALGLAPMMVLTNLGQTDSAVDIGSDLIHGTNSSLKDQ